MSGGGSGGGSLPAVESGILLRVPPALADQLRKQLQAPSGKKHGSSSHHAAASDLNISFEFTSDEGDAVFHVSSSASSPHPMAQSLKAQLMQLPTIIEALKTFDNRNYYKCTDISQMLVVESTPAPPAPSRPHSSANVAAAAAASASTSGEEQKDESKKDQDKDPRRFDYPHGLTPPTREIRYKRYERNTKVPRAIVSDVDEMLYNIQNNIAVDLFELVEEEVEESEEEEEEEEEEEGEGEEEYEAEGEVVMDEGEVGVHRMSTGRPDTEPRTGPRMDTGEMMRSGQAQASVSPAMFRHPHHYASPAAAYASSPMLQQHEQEVFSRDAMTDQRRTGKRTSILASPSMPGELDMVDALQFDIGAQPLPSVSPESIAAAAASSHAAAAAPSPAQPATAVPPPPHMTINVDSVERMFGDIAPQPQPPTHMPPAPALYAPPTAAASVSVSSPPIAGPPPALAPAPAPAPAPSPLDHLRAELADLAGPQMERAQRDVANAKNMLLRKKAQDALQQLMRTKEAKEQELKKLEQEQGEQNLMQT